MKTIRHIKYCFSPNSMLSIALLCWLLFPAQMKAQDIEARNVAVAAQLEGTIQDSVKLYKEAHRLVKISSQDNSPELLAEAYRNLALWHLGSATIDSTIYYLQQARDIYAEQQLTDLQAQIHLDMEDAYKQSGEYNNALQEDFKAIQLYETTNNLRGIAVAYTRLCDLLYYQEKHQEGADYCQKAIDIQLELEVPEELALSYRYKADNLLILSRHQDALDEINKAITLLKESGMEETVIAPFYNTRGNIYKFMERYDEALEEYQRCYEIAKKSDDVSSVIPSLGNMGHVNRIQGNYREAIRYHMEAIEIMQRTGDVRNLAENYMHVADSYMELDDFEQALEYERLFSGARFRNLEKIIQQLESELQIKYETAKKDETIEEQGAEINRQRKIQLLYIGIAILLAIILFGMFFTIRNIRRKRKALAALNTELEEKKKDVEASNSKLSKSLKDLKEAQAQLIQSEKMASLGELTAGIAHEIQNPLNFVNNFSEVSLELVEEMKEELNSGDIAEASLLANDVQQNLEKITHHGKRADAIVKGMLQHSRKSSAEKEPTDINKLADEYLRLAYHGLRAKDKSFNATLETHFDEALGTVDVIPQDMGRVFLNLITNAFYAVSEKKKLTKDPVYKPTVTLRTERHADEFSVLVKDNGNGISEEVIHKVFQPFFTTKPTGEGTGLGLSMSYDIVKAHGGELSVSTEKGQYTLFKIIIPIPKKPTS